MNDRGTVGFQGELGAFSQEAVRTLAPGFRAQPRRSFLDVVRGVEAGEDVAGVLPVENTLAGGVTPAFDALLDRDVEIVGETALPIRHFLLGLPGSDLSSLVEVRSHPVALAQCRDFFEAHPDIEPVAVHDTAGAARQVAEEGVASVAALAGRQAAEPYRLEILAENLQDRDDNQTRFVMIARTGGQAGPAGHAGSDILEGAVGRGRADHDEAAPSIVGPPWKTALSVETPNRPGALHDLLGVFAERGLDLTFIVSRPTGTPWTYRFFLEFRHEQPAIAADCVRAAERDERVVRRLGTYGIVEI